MNVPSPLIEFLIKLTLVGLALHLGLIAMHAKSAAARHSLIKIGFAAFALLPILMLMPSWNVPGWSRTVLIDFPTSAALFTPTPGSALELLNPLNILLMLWAAGFLLAGMRMVAGFHKLWQKNRSLDEVSTPGILNQLEELGGDRKITIRLGEDGSQPMTWGHLRPTIVLPRDADAWNERRLKAILAHEIAHVDRADWLSSIFAGFVSCIYWFHPLVWLSANRMSAESERAADDRALLAGCAPVDYAFHLLETAKSYRGSKKSMGIAMAKTSPLKRRLSGILAKQCERRPLNGQVTALLGVGFTILAAVIATGTATSLVVVGQPPLAKKVTFERVASVKRVPNQISKVVIDERKRSVKKTEPAVKSAMSLDLARNEVHTVHSKRNREFHFAKAAPDSVKAECSVPQPELEAVNFSQSDDNEAAADDLQSAEEAKKSAEFDMERSVAKAMKEAVATQIRLSPSDARLFKAAMENARQSVRAMQSQQGPAHTVKGMDIRIPDIKIDEQGFKLRIPSIHVHVPEMKIKVSTPVVVPKVEIDDTDEASGVSSSTAKSAK